MRTIACRAGLFWFDYPKGCTDCEEKHNTSQQNSLEASMALKVVRSMELLINRRNLTVMVITFYKSQEALIKKVFEADGLK